MFKKWSDRRGLILGILLDMLEFHRLVICDQYIFNNKVTVFIEDILIKIELYSRGIHSCIIKNRTSEGLGMSISHLSLVYIRLRPANHRLHRTYATEVYTIE